MNVISFNGRYKDELVRMYCRAHKTDGHGRHADGGIWDRLRYSCVKLLRINNLIEGYILYSRRRNPLIRNTVSIDDMYVDGRYSGSKNYAALLESTRRYMLFRHYDYAQINVDDKNEMAHDIVSMPNVSLERELIEMRMDLNGDLGFEQRRGVEFRTFRVGSDEPLRVRVQNSIFNDSKWHMNYTIDDVLREEEQDYFLEQGGIFVYYNGNAAGYSQVILKNGDHDSPCIVNFGICGKYRGMGLAKPLLKYTLHTIERMGQHCAYIDVEAGNIRAYDLYRDAGFEKVGSQNSYLYKFR